MKRKEYPFEHNWSEKQYFIHACLSDDLQVFYRNWIDQKKDRIQYFTSLNGVLEHRYWIPSNICVESGEVLTADNIDVMVGYWTPNIWKPIRKDLKVASAKEEAFLCQKIDCSCNDCAFLDRKNKWCSKFDKETAIKPNLCHPENQDCFKHRKELTPPPHKH